LDELWYAYEKMTLTFDLWPWNEIGFVRLSQYMFVQNFIKLSAAVHELSCPEAFLPYKFIKWQPLLRLFLTFP